MRNGKPTNRRPAKFTPRHAHNAPRHAHNAPRDKQETLAKVAGLSAVSALFEKAPERVERLYFEPRLQKAAGPFCSILATLRKPYRMVEADELARIAGTALHGGIVAAAKPREPRIFSPQDARRWAQDGKPLLILDGVSNPHNLGAIARTAAFFGMQRLLLSDHPSQAGLSDASFRVAEGGLDQMEIYKTTKLLPALAKLRDYYRLVATAPGKHTPLPTLRKGDKPFALILGNEEIGLPPATMKACDDIVVVQGGGAIQSLNVSSCAAIVLYALATLSER